ATLGLDSTESLEAFRCLAVEPHPGLLQIGAPVVSRLQRRPREPRDGVAERGFSRCVHLPYELEVALGCLPRGLRRIPLLRRHPTLANDERVRLPPHRGGNSMRLRELLTCLIDPFSRDFNLGKRHPHWLRLAPLRNQPDLVHRPPNRSE